MNDESKTIEMSRTLDDSHNPCEIDKIKILLTPSSNTLSMCLKNARAAINRLYFDRTLSRRRYFIPKMIFICRKAFPNNANTR